MLLRLATLQCTRTRQLSSTLLILAGTNFISSESSSAGVRVRQPITEIQVLWIRASGGKSLESTRSKPERGGGGYSFGSRVPPPRARGGQEYGDGGVHTPGVLRGGRGFVLHEYKAGRGSLY